MTSSRQQCTTVELAVCVCTKSSWLRLWDHASSFILRPTSRNLNNKHCTLKLGYRLGHGLVYQARPFFHPTNFTYRLEPAWIRQSVCVCVRVYIIMCPYMRVCICAYVYACMHAYVHVCVCACMLAYVCACVHVCTHVCIIANPQYISIHHKNSHIMAY